MEGLKGLDDVAYVRFASVYKNFREAKDFEELIGELTAEEPTPRAPPDRARPRGPTRERGPAREPRPERSGRGLPRTPTGRALHAASRWRSARATSACTWPNPAVGAVVVGADGDGPVILGAGWTQPGGRPHAERVALEQAGEAARGATLYVTLEPCSHHGRTPPCADAISTPGSPAWSPRSRIPIRGCTGAGISRLRAAGVEVVTGVLAREARGGQSRPHPARRRRAARP